MLDKPTAGQATGEIGQFLEIAENTTVNRPFSAFAALMTLLALAMFAVSASSRSTSVQPAGRVQGSGFRVRGKGFEARDRKSEVRSQKLVGTSKKHQALKTRENALVAAPANFRLDSLRTGNRGRRSAMLPARVVMAENSLARMRIPSPVDCRSHYDATYDLLVYGITDKAAEMPHIPVESQAALPANLAGELDVIFRELASRQSVQPLPQAGAMNVDRKGADGKSVDREAHRWKALAAAIGGWVKYHASQWLESQLAERTTRQTGMPVPPVEWAEYSEFADRVSARNIANTEATATLDAQGVRSSGWLRHSAASSLHQLSSVLQAAAEELEGSHRPELSVMAK